MKRDNWEGRNCKCRVRVPSNRWSFCEAVYSDILQAKKEPKKTRFFFFFLVLLDLHWAGIKWLNAKLNRDGGLVDTTVFCLDFGTYWVVPGTVSLVTKRLCLCMLPAINVHHLLRCGCRSSLCPSRANPRPALPRQYWRSRVFPSLMAPESLITQRNNMSIPAGSNWHWICSDPGLVLLLNAKRVEESVSYDAVPMASRRQGSTAANHSQLTQFAFQRCPCVFNEAESASCISAFFQSSSRHLSSSRRFGNLSVPRLPLPD